MKQISVAYCTGFWCTNIGNAFFSLGVEYILKSVFGDKNVTILSDYQTYTNAIGKRLYPDKRQLEYLSSLDVDYIVLAGPILSKYFLPLWKDILIRLHERGIRYMLLSAGTMKLDGESKKQIISFFADYPPYILVSREEAVYNDFGLYADHAYNGICFSFFAPDYYSFASMHNIKPYIICNFDKIGEPSIWKDDALISRHYDQQFIFQEDTYCISYGGVLSSILSRTDRYTDAFIYVLSILPTTRRADAIGKYKVIRTDHRFHPHYRSKIYKHNNSFCADIPYGYLNLYANAELTLSDRIHACAVALAFGNSAMLFAKTSRAGLLERVGAYGITEHPVKLNPLKLNAEKNALMQWLEEVIHSASNRPMQETEESYANDD